MVIMPHLHIVLEEEINGLHNGPTTQAICKIVKKFKETGVVKKIERPVQHRIAIVSECVDSSSFSGIRTVLRHIMAYSAFGSTYTYKNSKSK